jgi:MEDS: MEthanogen/methylotroph, DcmR Sensory domain
MCTHAVHFYDTAYPARAASDFIAAGLSAGDTCVLMLTQPARSAVERCLKERGIATGPDSTGSKVCRGIDTYQVLSELVADGRLDLQRSAEVLGSLLSDAGSGRRVRLVGDPAAVLFASGNERGATALEELVDELRLLHHASVFCAYPLQRFFNPGNTLALLRTSAHHASVAFPEGLWIRPYLEPAPAPHYFGRGRARTG